MFWCVNVCEPLAFVLSVRACVRVYVLVCTACVYVYLCVNVCVRAFECAYECAHVFVCMCACVRMCATHLEFTCSFSSAISTNLFGTMKYLRATTKQSTCINHHPQLKPDNIN
jgi:hypothetical protein